MTPSICGWTWPSNRGRWPWPVPNIEFYEALISRVFSNVQAVGLSRIARGEVVSFCVPAVFWWLLSYSTRVHVSFLLLCAVLCCFGIFFCILCFFRSYLVSLQYFDGFYHIRQEFMYHVCCCAQYFVALAFSSAFFVFFVLTLCPCNILMAFIIFGNSSSIIFAVVRSTLLLLSFHLHSQFLDLEWK